MRPLRILLTNNTVARRAGSELYLRDLAIGLRNLGLEPAAYSNQLGVVAEDLKAAGIPVFDRLDELTWVPDIIHGQHHLETMTALLQYPRVPAVYFCHGWIPWQEIPPKHPRIMKYIAVDDLTRDHIVNQHGILPDSTQVIYNFVDLTRFQRRGSLPEQPKRALLLSNYVDQSLIQPVRDACARTGIALDVYGAGIGKVLEKPEQVIIHYDLVFAKGRTAIEALAAGTAVIICDAFGLGPLVTSEEFESLRRGNFGIATFRSSLTAATLIREISRYDPTDACNVTDRIRSTAGLEEAVARIYELYQQVLAEFSSRTIDVRSEANAASFYLRWLSFNVKDGLFLREEKQRIMNFCNRIGGEPTRPTRTATLGSIERFLKKATRSIIVNRLTARR